MSIANNKRGEGKRNELLGYKTGTKETRHYLFVYVYFSLRLYMYITPVDKERKKNKGIRHKQRPD
jgi:hypothetical protein